MTNTHMSSLDVLKICLQDFFPSIPQNHYGIFGETIPLPADGSVVIVLQIIESIPYTAEYEDISTDSGMERNLHQTLQETYQIHVRAMNSVPDELPAQIAMAFSNYESKAILQNNNMQVACLTPSITYATDVSNSGAIYSATVTVLGFRSYSATRNVSYYDTFRRHEIID